MNRAFGATLRRFVSNSTSNRFSAFGVGVCVASILQSSTAAAMIVSSFAARNIITVPAAIAVMLGADVGTTLAAQALSFNLGWLVPVLLTSGYIVNKSMEASQYKYIGRAMIGISLILIALGMIKTVAEPLKQAEALHLMITPLTEQPLLAIALSALITWLVHSSLGMVLLYVSFVHVGTVPVALGFLLVLGANAGGAIAPVIMTLRDIPAGRRVPLGNLMMRCLGVLICTPFVGIAAEFIARIDPEPTRQLVNFHTAFNIALALLFLPLIGPMTKLSSLILRDRPSEEDESQPRYLDPTAFSTPPAALACVSRETMRVADIIQKMMRLTLECFRVNNTRLVSEVRELESVVDGLYEAIKNYLARLSTEELDKDESRRYMQILTFSTNLEHAGDIIDKNLMDMAATKIRNQDSFSRQGFAEIADLHRSVTDNMTLAQNVFMTGDVQMARKLFEAKTGLREQEMVASEKHFKRLSAGVAETVATSNLHLDILRDLRRINSYVSLIAYPILEAAGELKTTRLKPSRAAPRKSRVRKRKKARSDAKTPSGQS